MDFRVKTFGKRIIKLLVVLFLGVFLASCEINQYFENEYHFHGTSSDPQINEVYQLLTEYYYDDLPIDVGRLDSVEQLLQYVDRYTYIFEGARDIDQGEKYLGIGITITDHEDGLLIKDVNMYVDIDDKIFIGDIIIEVDAERIKDLTFEQKTQKLKGKENQIKTLLLRRLNESVIVDVPIIEIPSPSINSFYVEEGNIGVIQILRFEFETHIPFNQALHQFEQNGMEKLIIDVRDNGGGYVNSSIEILKNFVYGEDPYIYMLNVKQNTLQPYKPLKTTERKPYDIITLINNNSASASEMIAGTLMQFNYKTFGELTYGKDLYQLSIQLQTFPDIHYLSMTLGYWLLKDKTTVRGGIEPSIFFNESGMRAFAVPTLERTFEKGDSSKDLMVFQYLIATEVEGSYELGLFNQDFVNMVKAYQQKYDLEQTGKLDTPTMMRLIIYYRNLVRSKENDNLLNEAIKYARDAN